MLSGGTLIWYFFLGRVVTETGSEGSWAVLAILSWPLFDAALLFLCLVVLSAASKPPFAGLLAAGFLAFVVADGLYLGASSGDSYENAGWPDVFCALGLVLLCLAALRAAPASVSAQLIEPWRIFASWLGPLSPAVHLAVVLFCSTSQPPLRPTSRSRAASSFSTWPCASL